MKLFKSKSKPSLIATAFNKEVEALDQELLKEEKFIGDIFRDLSKGITVEEIANKAGHKNSKNVVTFEYTIKALRGITPIANLNYNSRKQLIFSAERLLAATNDQLLKDYLNKKLEEAKELNRKQFSKDSSSTVNTTEPTPVAPQSTAPVQEVVTPVSSNVEAKPGVYVYSYPQYLAMEAISPEGRGLYKIGASGSVAQRVERQRRQTEVPEDLVLVRTFYSDEPFELEAKFHNILKAANMHQKSTQGGTEWFSAPLAMIDAIAEAVMMGRQ